MRCSYESAPKMTALPPSITLGPRAQSGVRAETRGGEVYALTDGNWPTAKPDYTIRYATWLTSRSGQTILMSGSSQKLGMLHDSPFYEKAPPFGGESYRVECDYEIWAGAPGRGKLLAKNSVFSPWYDR